MKKSNINEYKGKNTYDSSRRNNYAANSKDLIQTFKNKVQELYGVDEIMLEMCKSLIEGKEIVSDTSITMPTSVIKPLKLIEYEKTGKAKTDAEALEYEELASEFSKKEQEYNKDMVSAMEKLKLKEKINEKQSGYKQTLCSIICSIVPRPVLEEIQLMEGAMDEATATGYISKFGFITHDPKLLLNKVKAALDHEHSSVEESNATKKEKWLSDMYLFKQYDKEHVNSYVLRFNELMKRGDLVYGSRDTMYEQYQNEPFLAKKLLDGLKDKSLIELYNTEALKSNDQDYWLKTIGEAKKLIERKHQQNGYVKNIRVEAQQKSAFYQGDGTAGNSKNVKKNKESKEKESKESWHYCAYCDRKGHYKSNCRVLKDHEERDCVNQEWLNKPKEERRCNHCQKKGHFLADCNYRKQGKPAGDYSEKKKKGLAAVVTKEDGVAVGRHYGFMIQAEVIPSKKPLNLLSFDINEEKGTVIVHSRNGTIESRIQKIDADPLEALSSGEVENPLADSVEALSSGEVENPLVNSVEASSVGEVENPLVDSVEASSVGEVENPLADSVEALSSGEVENPLADSVEALSSGEVENPLVDSVEASSVGEVENPLVDSVEASSVGEVENPLADSVEASPLGVVEDPLLAYEVDVESALDNTLENNYMEEHRITVLTTAKYEEGDYEQVYSNNRIVVDTKDLIILDTGATVSIFGNLNLVENVHASEPISVTGISNQKVTIAKKGNCTALFGMEVYVDDSIHINIISFAELDKLVRIERSSTGFISEPVIWHLVDNLYMYSLKCDCAELKRDVYKLVKTNVERRAELENRELSNKERFLMRIEKLLGRLGISPTMLKKIVKNNIIIGLNFEEKDIDSLINNYGCSLEYKSSRAIRIRKNVQLPLYDEIKEKIITLFCDLFKTYGQWFCLVVCSHTKAYHCMLIDRRGSGEITEAIIAIIRVIRNQGWNARVLYMDGEQALKVSDSIENMEGIRLIKLPATKIGEVEVAVRIIKERVWYRHGLLQFNLVAPLVEYIVNCMVRMINISPKEIDGKVISSREFITGHKIRAAQVQYSFGDIVGAYVGGTEERRYKPALVLYPTFEADNSYILLDLTPNKRGEMGRINIIKTGSVCNIEWNADLIYTIESMGGIVEKEPLEDELEELEGEAIENISNIAIEESAVELVLSEQVKYRRVYVGDKTTDKMNFETAQRLYPNLVEPAIESELGGFLDMNAIDPSDEFVRDAIRSFGFFKVKRDAITGKVIKLKYRLVINGKLKRLSGFYDNFDRDFAGYTPAWSHTAAFMSINAARGRHFMLMDVKQAYLQTENKLGHHMIMSKAETDVLVKLRPEWEKFVRKNGELIVKVKKSIYGLKESGRLWYEEFVKRATEYPGIKVNPVDVCFMGNDNLGMCLYVDDNLVCGTIEELNNFRIHMEKYFGDMVCSKIDDFAYLGMHVTIIDGRVELRSDAYCKKLIADNIRIITNEYNTPCNKDLFIEVDDDQEIEKKLKETFHSIVASLLYIAMRVRLDILLPVVYLATRVHDTTMNDVDKLRRVLGYLKRYPERYMILKVDDPTALVIRAYADASYGVYSKGRKSQTGIYITLGIGCIVGRSVKQKLTAVSSTEAEITALSQMVRTVLGLAQFLKAQGEDTEKMRVILFEDNSSAIQMIKNGRALSESTKHISIHKFFIKQHLTPEGLLELIQCTTIEQIANGFTKPLSLNEFIRFLVDIGMKIIAEDGDQQSKSLILLHDGTGVLLLLELNIRTENVYEVHFSELDLGSVFEVPVVNRTENASVATESNTASVGDYTNAKGKQLLTYIQNKSQSYGPVFVADGSHEPAREFVEKNGTDNLVEQGSVTTSEEGESRVSVGEAAEAAKEQVEQVEQVDRYI